jgi:UDP-2,3-diacylglucosamine hydrolase
VSERLGLIAGSGRLPFEVADAAREQGIAFSVVAIEDNTDPAIEKVPAEALQWVAAGELGRLIDFLRASGATQVILAGAVA